MKYRLTARELSNFFGQMGMLVHSGISVSESLHILLDESTTDTDRQVLTLLTDNIEKTGSFSQACTDAECFPASVSAYLKTGEETGCLDEILTSLSEHYDREQEISDQIRNAVTYPLIMLGMMGVVIVVLLVKVLPVFRQVFLQMGMDMNGFSRGLLNAGNVISRYSTVFLILTALLILAVLFFCLNTRGRHMLTAFVYRLPGLRDIPVSMDYSRMTQGLSLGLRSGLSAETSLSLASEMVSHPLVLELLQKASALIEEGVPFSHALTESGLFAGMEGRMISVSFQSGTSDEALGRLSEKYQEKSLDLISQTISVVEPTIVILLSLLVGLVLLAVMMPLLGILSDIAM